MENWREGTRTGHTHEPNDVTVRLDGLGRQLAELPVEPSPPDPSEGPVFVDESGRRGKTYRRLGWVLAAICAVYAVTLVVAVLGGNSTAPRLPLSGQEEKQAGDIEVGPAPTDADEVSASPGATPTASVSAPVADGAASPSASASVAGPPGTAASASAFVTPPRGDGAKPDPGTSVSASPAGSPSPSDTEPPVVVSPPPSEDPSVPPVEEEGTQ
ncbi:hypothetical protein OG596_23015 [Streptomyces sp. NBC_01102]|uniref:hypothetical protein n=1 Tax=unclassified Streptomyces TaxID=2593676 RepID=UPI003867CA23|nr:hypothetical protein OG596_23015 [Streptomyces sp. NBC_01102]